MNLKTDTAHDHALRVAAAKEGVSCQEYVSRLLAEKFASKPRPATLKCLDGEK
jgi:hypothetical protein